MCTTRCDVDVVVQITVRKVIKYSKVEDYRAVKYEKSDIFQSCKIFSF